MYQCAARNKTPKPAERGGIAPWARITWAAAGLQLDITYCNFIVGLIHFKMCWVREEWAMWRASPLCRIVRHPSETHPAIPIRHSIAIYCTRPACRTHMRPGFGIRNVYFQSHSSCYLLVDFSTHFQLSYLMSDKSTIALRVLCYWLFL